MNSYIEEYYQKIKDGSIIAGKWILMLYEKIIKGLENKDYRLDLKKANRAIRFIENFCHHSEGTLAPQLLKLELWQKSLISIIFGIVDEEGTRQFREILVVVGRKNGKTLLASAIIAYMTFLDGEYGAKTFCLAPKLDQTDLVYNAFKQSVEMEEELNAMMKSRKSDLYIAETNSSVKRIAFNEKKSDGFNPHLVICDEVASWGGDKGLKQYEVMKSALGSRKQPLIVSITTSGYENDGIYDELVKRSTRFLLGESNETKLAPFLYMIDDTEKWNDINELKKSNPNLGVSVSIDYMIEEIAVAENSLSKKAEFMTKYCNIKQNSSQAWLNSIDILKCFSGKDMDLTQYKNCYCVGGIDLSQTTDLTCCAIALEKDGVVHIHSQFFMPENKLDEHISVDNVPYREYIKQGYLRLSGQNYVDYHDIYNWFTTLIEKYKIYPLKIGYDRYSAQYLVEDMKKYGFHMDDVFQGNNLTPIIQEVEGAIKDGIYDFGNNNLMKIHLLNSALKQDTESNKVRLVKLGKTQRIDGVATLLDAICVRQKYYKEIGARLKN